MKTLSVIIPVYKVEPYLRECVDSVLAQTFRDMEIILVDDGSPDHCPALCDEYARQDARILVVHQANQGLSAARNAGLEVAQGQFIAFVDSDDSISPCYFEAAMEAFQRFHDADVVELPFLSRYNTPKSYRHMPAETLVFKGHEQIFSEWFARKGYLFAYSQTKVCRRELFLDLRFPVGKTFEDLHVISSLLTISRVWVSISHPTANYFYRWREESITGQTSLKDLNSQLEALSQVAQMSEDYTNVSEADRQQFTLAVTNLLIDAQRAAQQEQKTLPMDFHGELNLYIERHRPRWYQLLSLPLSLRVRIKNLPLSIFGLNTHLRCYR